MVEITLIGAWVTLLVTRSYLLTPVRDFFARWPIVFYLLTCPMCFGSWTGLIVSYYLKGGLLLGMATVSLFSYLLVLITDLIGSIEKWLVTAAEAPQKSGEP
jgi:hypothetical protein